LIISALFVQRSALQLTLLDSGLAHTGALQGPHDSHGRINQVDTHLALMILQHSVVGAICKNQNNTAMPNL
jgi:hypothetical protein